MSRGQTGLAFRAVVIAVAAIIGVARQATADTLLRALAQAYQVNPELNSQRAIVRKTDESVPEALSGYRPRVSVTARAGDTYTSQETSAGCLMATQPHRLIQ
jgi:outer membrane protein